MFVKLPNCSDFARALVNGAILYLLWTVAHYVAAHLYTQFCVPLTISGFILSIFMVATPQCRALQWVVYNGAAAINGMWILVGVWLVSYIVGFTKTIHT